MAWSKSLAVLGVALALVGCDGDDDSCDGDLVERAVAFLDAHQSCETDDDCSVVGDSCGDIPGGYCGQLPMNREGAESEEWAALGRELSECGPSSCVVCNAALVPTCTNGSCKRR